MKSELLVSVLMITYNHEKYIEEAINGVLMQECDFNFELVIANDHSSDHTDSIIRQLISVHPKGYLIKYYHRDTNLGMVINFIDTFKKCSGKYIAICEGDDYWTNTLKLQNQVNFLGNNPGYSMVCHDALVIDKMHNSPGSFFTADHKKQICTTKDTLNIHFCPTSSILFRKQAFSLVNELDIINISPMAGDHLLVQLLSLNGLIYRAPEVMSIYRHHLSGISTVALNYRSEALVNRIQTLKYLNRISGKKFNNNIRIEIFLIKNRIQLMKTNFLPEIFFLKVWRKLLSWTKRFFLK